MSFFKITKHDKDQSLKLAFWLSIIFGGLGTYYITQLVIMSWGFGFLYILSIGIPLMICKMSWDWYKLSLKDGSES